MNRILLLLTFLFSVLFFWEVYPAEPPQEDTFGPEWTFSDSRGGEVAPYELVDLQNHMIKHLIADQPEGEKFTVTNGTFFSPEGWWVNTKHDIGSIEVTSSPLTVQQWKRYASNINDAVFVSAANINMVPALFRGGGHINVGVQKMSPLLMRNFLMDLLNHNELAMGVLSFDPLNAAPFEMFLHAEWQEKLIHLFAAYDSGSLRSDVPNAQDYFRDFTLYPADEHELFIFRFYKIFSSKKSALTVYNATRRREQKYRRIEIRSVRPQASMDVFVRQIELLQGRLNYLRSLNEPIPYKPACKFLKQNDPYTPPVDPQEALQAFYIYVEESGQRWQNHRDYLWPQWLNTGGELEKFESSDWFIQREYDRYFYNCGALLK